MTSDIERINFALHLTEMALHTLNEEDWQKLVTQVRDFLNGKAPGEGLGAAYETDFFFWKEKKISPEILASIQGIVRYVLMGIATENWRIKHGEIPSWEAGGTILPSEVSVAAYVDPSTRAVKSFRLRIEIEEGGQVLFELLPGDFRPYLVGTSIKNSFLFGLASSLSRVDVSYLRRCPACAKIFFADHGRQEHCSPRCASRERKRRVRAAAQQKFIEQRRKEGKGAPEPQSPFPIAPFTLPRRRKEKGS